LAMKLVYTLSIIAALSIAGGGLLYLIGAGAAATGTNVGDRAINISFTTTQGTTFDLSSHRDRVVVVDFMTTSCPVCVDEFTQLKQLAGDGGVLIVSVNLDSNSLGYLGEFSNYYGVNWIVGSSQKAGSDYQVSAVPTMLVIDRQGVIRYRSYYTELSQLEQIVGEYSK